MSKMPPQSKPEQVFHLLGFVTDLLRTGDVLLSPVLEEFTRDDMAQTAGLLAKFHAWDALEMPLEVPEFDPYAAVWAARYVCRCLQFVMIRNWGEALFPQFLSAFDRPKDASAIYSADLCLRHLPSIFALAKGLSPDDPLVKNLRQTAADWPFSSVGIDVETHFDCDHPSLHMAYADRVLLAKDRQRANAAAVNQQVQAALGAHKAAFWPSFEPIDLE
jgi:hypothetical protein